MPSTYRKPRVTTPIGGDGFDPAEGGTPYYLVAKGVNGAHLEDTGVSAGTYIFPASIEIDSTGRIIGITAGSNSTPTKVELLNVTGSAVTVANIHNASTIMFFRSGVLQSSNQYTISPNTITNNDADVGDYDDETLVVIYW